MLVQAPYLVDSLEPSQRPPTALGIHWNHYARESTVIWPSWRSTVRASVAQPLMKVATFNVKGIKGRLPRLVEWLAETKPDVACLQEIKTGDATFPIEAMQGAGYQAVWHGQPRHHGVAILARGEKAIEVRRGLPGDDADGHARYLVPRP